MIQYSIKLGGNVDGISFLGDELLLHGRYTVEYGPRYDDALNRPNFEPEPNRNDVRRTLYTFRLSEQFPRIRRVLSYDDERPLKECKVVRKLNDHVYRADAAKDAGKYLTRPMPNVRIPNVSDLQLRHTASGSFAWFVLSEVLQPNLASVVLGKYEAVYLYRTTADIKSIGKKPALKNVILDSSPGRSSSFSMACVKLCRDGFLYAIKSYADSNCWQLLRFAPTSKRRDVDYRCDHLQLPAGSIITDVDVTADGKLCAIAYSRDPHRTGPMLQRVSLFELDGAEGVRHRNVSLLTTLDHPAFLLAFSPDGLTLAMSVQPYGPSGIYGIRIIDIDR